MIEIIKRDEYSKIEAEVYNGFEFSIWVEPIEYISSTKFRFKNIKIEYFYKNKKKHELLFESAYFTLMRTARSNVPDIHELRKKIIDEL